MTSCIEIYFTFVVQSGWEPPATPALWGRLPEEVDEAEVDDPDDGELLAEDVAVSVPLEVAEALRLSEPLLVPVDDGVSVGGGAFGSVVELGGNNCVTPGIFKFRPLSSRPTLAKPVYDD